MWSNFFWMRSSAAAQMPYPELRLNDRYYYEGEMFVSPFNNSAKNCLSLYRFPKTHFIDIGFTPGLFLDHAPFSRTTSVLTTITALMLGMSAVGLGLIMVKQLSVKMCVLSVGTIIIFVILISQIDQWEHIGHLNLQTFVQCP